MRSSHAARDRDKLGVVACALCASFVVLSMVNRAAAQDGVSSPDGYAERLLEEARTRAPSLDQSQRSRLVEALQSRDWVGLEELLSAQASEADGEGAAEGEEESEEAELDAKSVAAPLSLPGGGGSSPASSQQISLPKGEGTIQGMGESFTPSLSSGTGTYSVPVALPAGRAGVGPSLSFSYSTSGGNGPLGIGWSLSVPFIARQTDKGLPRYVDGPSWTEQEDRFIYNGGQELVPVDSDEARAVDGAPVPAELSTWQQYRARVEGTFMRFFRAPDASRWVVQSKDGSRFEFGCLAGASQCDASAVQADPEDESHIFSWQLVRMSDVHGASIHYRYVSDGGLSYLSSIYYDMPARCGVPQNPAATRGCSAPLSDYGRRVQLVYDTREDVASSYVSTWRTEQRLRLIRVEVTSHLGQVGARYLVRRYHLGYDLTSYHSLLTSLEVEGRPTVDDDGLGVHVAGPPVPEQALGDRIVGTLLPAMQFSYTQPRSASGYVSGFGGIDSTVHTSAASPPHSLDEARTELFDVNGDGLSDVIVTDPARYRGGVGVFFNGFRGRNAAEAGSFSEAVRVGVPSGLGSVMTLSNRNVRPMDVDGDGHSDLLHMPRARQYGYFVLSKAPSAATGFDPLEGWSFAHVPVTLPQGQDPRVDLGADAPFIKTLDVNKDSLIDVVATTGSAVQAWLNLGNQPGGDGRFGSVRWTARGPELSSEPVASCLPVAGRPLDFSDAGTRFADMNGDGLLDIVQLSPRDVVYYAGRGEGAFGEGTHACGAAQRGSRHTRMADPPVQLNAELKGVHLVDLNGDGADDLLQVNYDRWNVWFNRLGEGFTERLVVRQTPISPASLDRVRLADIDGSGTLDVVFGDAHRYSWIDPMGGVRARLLQTVDNGIGALTTLHYGSSAEDYLRDLAEARRCDASRHDCFTWHREVRTGAGQPGCDARISARSGVCVHRPGTSPVVSTVVRRITTSDRLDALGVPAHVSESEYRYHDGYYEGIEQEFRGFGAADAIAHGDAYEPTSVTRSYFHQGRRPNAIAADRLADNPNEALKGLEFLTEVSNAAGEYLSSAHATFRVRKLMDGLDGRSVSHAWASSTDQLRYDTAPFTRASSSLAVPSIQREEAGPGLLAEARQTDSDAPHMLPVRGARYAHIRSTVDVVDNIGNVHRQTAVGRSGAGEAIVSETEVQRIDDSACGASGWLFRTRRTALRDGPQGAALGDTTNDYNACGDQVRSAVIAALPAEAPGGFTFAQGSGPGPSFTQTQQTLETSLQVDAWGQVVATCGGADLRAHPRSTCLRYREVAHDAAYATFVETETVATSFSGATLRGLTSRASWDAGLGLVTRVVDPNLTESKVYYDGLGRPTAVVHPNVQANPSCASAAVPTTRIFYHVTTTAAQSPLSRIHTITELDCSRVGQEMLQSHVYVDGLGRTRATLAQGDASADAWEDGRSHAWIRSGVQLLGRKGKPWREYQPAFHEPPPEDYRAALRAPGVPFTELRNDAFGRVVRTIDADRTSYSLTRYHALSTDTYDQIDVDDRCSVADESCLAGGSSTPVAAEDGHPTWFDHTFSTLESDGHDRVVAQHLRQAFHDGSSEHHYLFTYYRADGVVMRLVRALAPDGAVRPAAGSTSGLTRSTARIFYFDSAGRRIASSDPDTNLPGEALQQGVWRYLYNRVGDLVAVRDPRGSGQNFFYDRAGRLLGESYAYGIDTEPPPNASVETIPAGSVSLELTAGATMVQVRNFYDALPPWAAGKVAADLVHAAGRGTGTSDRGQRSAVAYDARGNMTWSAKQIALIGPARPLTKRLIRGVPAPQTGRLPDFVEGVVQSTPIAYDERHTYQLTQQYDHAGRVVGKVLPRDPDFGDTPGASGPVVGGELSYNASGRPDGATLRIDGARYPIVHRTSYTRDGLPSRTLFGDAIVTQRVRTDRVYDARRRPLSVRTVRARTPGAEARTLGAVTTLVAQDFHWDAASNLTGIDDLRPPTEWPEGHAPQTVRVRHDALYRVAGVEYTYAGGTRDAASDWRATADSRRAADPMHARPAPMLPEAEAGLRRVEDISYEHDWLANMTSFRDDADFFFERSIGEVVNGESATVTTSAEERRPSALYLADNVSSGAPNGHRGWLETTYGAGGNLATMTVHARCSDRSRTLTCGSTRASLEGRRADLRERCVCAAEQHYVYRYDELNRLSEARRFDREAGAWELKVRQRSLYDANNQRVVKHTLDAAGDSRVALYVLPGDFERRGLRIGVDSYQPIAGETETQYLVAGARVVWNAGDDLMPGIDADHRITLALTDLLQSTSAVIDLMSGEPLEVTGFYPNGAREHHLAASSADARDVPLEPVGFTGKEADEEVGLVYFGERYLVPRIGRWATPDPMHIHASGGGEALNAYHYVAGNLLQARDPLGLDPRGAKEVFYNTGVASSFWKDTAAQVERDTDYEVHTNVLATQNEIENQLAEANREDIVVFEGHGNPDAVAADFMLVFQDAVTGKDMADAVTRTDDPDEAVDAPGVVILGTCNSADGDLLKSLRDSGVGVSFGFHGKVSTLEARNASNAIVESLTRGDTIQEALDAGQSQIGGLSRGGATLDFKLRDDINPHLNLEDNGLSLPNEHSQAPPAGAGTGGDAMPAPAAAPRSEPEEA